MSSTARHIAIESPETYKEYLTDLFCMSVSNSITPEKFQRNLYDYAEQWGRVKDAADTDIRRAENVECAAKMFISKAVDENWDSIKDNQTTIVNNNESREQNGRNDSDER